MPPPAWPTRWQTCPLFTFAQHEHLGPLGPRAGRCVGRLDLTTGKKEILLGYRFKRPIDVCFGVDGSLYVLDFGHYEMRSATELDIVPSSGALYKIENPKFTEQTDVLF